MKKGKWIWMPHPGHLIVSYDCLFSLNTYVGKYIVSTVGEWLPAHKRNGKRADFKNDFKMIGSERLYETMVFKAVKTNEVCCPWRQISGIDLECDGYNDPGLAYQGHMQMCLKWSKK